MNTRNEIKDKAQLFNEEEKFALGIVKVDARNIQGAVLKIIYKIVKRLLKFIPVNSGRRLKLKQGGKIINGKVVSLLNHLSIQKTFKVENILDERNIMINYSPLLGFLFMIHLN